MKTSVHLDLWITVDTNDTKGVGDKFTELDAKIPWWLQGQGLTVLDYHGDRTYEYEKVDSHP